MIKTVSSRLFDFEFDLFYILIQRKRGIFKQVCLKRKIMGRLFGTDGARGVANKELTADLAMNIGRAAAMVLIKENNTKPKVLIGMDTRISGDMLEGALIAGLCSVGADVVLIGVVPTPATAYLIGKLGCTAGIMISASHNPCEYNGIKLFDKDGYKLPDEVEEEIEAIVLDGAKEIPVPIGESVGSVTRDYEAKKIYIDHVIKTTDVRFDGMKIALDCANGSSSVTAKDIFEGLGAECVIISAEPDGVNINDNCGSTHMENLCELVKNSDCSVGFAFDGDADRCLCVDENGEVVDGDKMIAIMSNDMKARGVLKQNTAVMTVMSNIGFFKFAENNGIDVKTTAVGDRYVLEEMRKSGFNIGGEQSGHIIFSDFASTGDGELSAVQILACMKRSGKKMCELGSVMDTYPQVLVNIKTTNEVKAVWADDESVKASIDEVNEKLGSDGRVLVRASGTEPLIRVMLEGKDIDEISKYAEFIADKIRAL